MAIDGKGFDAMKGAKIMLKIQSWRINAGQIPLSSTLNKTLRSNISFNQGFIGLEVAFICGGKTTRA